MKLGKPKRRLFKNMQIIKPPRLKIGSTVGIISPSGSPFDSDFTSQRFEKGIESLKNDFGLNVRIAENCREKFFYSAGTRAQRLEDLHTMWMAEDIDMIMMSIGGNTATELLDGIDFEVIRRNPKIFCGISDGTVLLNAIFAKTGLITYHGPDLCFTFGQPMSPSIRKNIQETFFEDTVQNLQPNPSWKAYEHPEVIYPGWRAVRSGKASGRLVGGHISLVLNNLSLGYAPNFEGSILFLEGTHKIESLHRDLYSLKLHGVFEKISGIILGWFEWKTPGIIKNDRLISDVVLEITKEYNFPIIEIGELGHCVENYIFPIGGNAVIDVDEKRISFD